MIRTPFDEIVDAMVRSMRAIASSFAVPRELMGDPREKAHELGSGLHLDERIAASKIDAELSDAAAEVKARPCFEAHHSGGIGGCFWTKAHP